VLKFYTSRKPFPFNKQRQSTVVVLMRCRRCHSIAVVVAIFLLSGRHSCDSTTPRLCKNCHLKLPGSAKWLCVACDTKPAPTHSLSPCKKLWRSLQSSRGWILVMSTTLTLSSASIVPS